MCCELLQSLKEKSCPTLWTIKWKSKFSNFGHLSQWNERIISEKIQLIWQALLCLHTMQDKVFACLPHAASKFKQKQLHVSECGNMAWKQQMSPRAARKFSLIVMQCPKWLFCNFCAMAPAVTLCATTNGEQNFQKLAKNYEKCFHEALKNWKWWISLCFQQVLEKFLLLLPQWFSLKIDHDSLVVPDICQCCSLLCSVILFLQFLLRSTINLCELWMGGATKDFSISSSVWSKREHPPTRAIVRGTGGGCKTEQNANTFLIDSVNANRNRVELFLAIFVLVANLCHETTKAKPSQMEGHLVHSFCAFSSLLQRQKWTRLLNCSKRLLEKACS